MPGFGHPIFETDPRREAIEQLLHVDMGHVRKLLEIEKLLPVKANMAGFTAAIALDLDVPVEATGGFFLVGRSIGLIAHAVDQQNNPRMKLWQQQQ